MRLSTASLCQRLDSRQLTQIRAPEAREKIEREARARAPKARESAGGERRAQRAFRRRRKRFREADSGAKLLQRPHKLDKLQFLGLWHRLLNGYPILIVIMVYALEWLSALYPDFKTCTKNCSLSCVDVWMDTVLTSWDNWHGSLYLWLFCKVVVFRLGW